MKQAQLEIASRGKALLADVQALDALKGRDHRPAGLECSWAYFAGLFDADGCIRISAVSVTLILRVVQKKSVHAGKGA